jgi:hypothetical protein
MDTLLAFSKVLLLPSFFFGTYILLPCIDFKFYNFNHSFYSTNYASITCFVCHVFYYCRYIKIDFSFYTFAIFFLKIEWVIKVIR